MTPAPTTIAPDWIAVDWGTTRLRAWAMRGDRPVAETASDAGMATLAPDGFEPALGALIAPWGAAPVLACGMVGARGGWVEAPYAPVPCAPVARPVAAPAQGLSVAVLPGLRQDDPADVMRGEETQIAGLLAQDPDFDGVACLPGSHSKWVRVSAGEVVGFRTFMTGELFAALAEHTVLAKTLAAEGWDDDAFAVAVDEGMCAPQQLAGRLFGLRAEALLTGLAPASARARLSGLLIGAELAASRGWWLGQRVALVGAPALTARYAAALAQTGATPSRHDGAAAALAGLAAARRTLAAPA